MTDFNVNSLCYEIENITRNRIHVCGKNYGRKLLIIKVCNENMNADIDGGGHVGRGANRHDEYRDT